MANDSSFESDTFDPAKLWGIICKSAGWLLIAAGLFTLFIGFRLDGTEYRGLMTGLGFALPGVTILGIGYVLSAVATLGEMLLASRKT